MTIRECTDAEFVRIYNERAAVKVNQTEVRAAALRFRARYRVEIDGARFPESNALPLPEDMGILDVYEYCGPLDSRTRVFLAFVRDRRVYGLEIASYTE